MEHGRLIEMGQLTTIDSDGTKTEYKRALVIEFASEAELKQAIEDEVCTFGWGTDIAPGQVGVDADVRALPRYGLAWNGPKSFVATEMSDGYFTPWHIADAEITRLRHEVDVQSYWGPEWQKAYNEVRRLKAILAAHGIAA